MPDTHYLPAIYIFFLCQVLKWIGTVSVARSNYECYLALPSWVGSIDRVNTLQPTGQLHYLHSKGAFFWDYSGIGIFGIDGIPVLLGAIRFSE